jgi:dihydroneopterin aldolase
MAWIEIEGMEFYAYHGHFEEAQIIGNRFILDFKFKTKTKKAERSDQLEDTVDYSKVYLIIKREMGEKSYLIEHKAANILTAIHKDFPEIKKMNLKMKKLNPPIGNKVANVNITLERDYS